MILTPYTMMPMMGLNFLSPDGKCFSFDSRANGYGRGEGIGVLVIKRLETAIQDRNPLRCIIRGTAVNQDGRTPGITVPSMEAQAENIQTVYQNAGLGFEQTAFVECHGTGTQAGDWRELRAIANTIAKGRDEDRPLLVGSIKPSVGHLEGAAGVAGVIKMILCLETGMIPKNLRFNPPGNPDIDFVNWRVKVPTENMAWPMDGIRRGSVNCFGFGGTNAHAILDGAHGYLLERSIAYPLHNTTLSGLPRLVSPVSGVSDAAAAAAPHAEKSLLFVYSANDRSGVSRVLASHAEYLKSAETPGKNTSMFLADYSYTLLERRSVLAWKTHLVARTVQDLIEKLSGGGGGAITPTKSSKTTGLVVAVAYVFCGQGAQWAGMGRDLMAQYQTYRDSVLDSSKFLVNHLGADLDISREMENHERISDALISQPATTILQMALVDLLESFGVRPAAVIGHSSGEIAAAYAKKAVSRASALKLAYYRGQAVAAQLRIIGMKGRMVTVSLPHEKVQDMISKSGLQGSVFVACINSDNNTTVSGSHEKIVKFHEYLSKNSADGAFVAMIPVSAPYHSPHMYKVEEKYRLLIRDVVPLPETKESTVPMYSSVKARVVSNQELEPEYWCRNMVSHVDFAGAFRAFLSSTTPVPDVVMELGPHQTLRCYIQDMTSAMLCDAAPLYVSALRRNMNGAETFLRALGEIFEKKAGFPKGFSPKALVSALEPNAQHRVCMNLPPYPFNHDTRYRWELPSPNRLPDQRQDLIGRPVPTGTEPESFHFRAVLRPDEAPYLKHHLVQGATVYPAAGSIVMAIQAAYQIARHGPAWSAIRQGRPSAEILGLKVSQMDFRRPIVVPGSERGLEVNFLALRRRKEPAVFDFTITSSSSSLVNSRGTLEIVAAENKALEPLRKAGRKAGERFQKTEAECLFKVDVDALYRRLKDAGLDYGAVFRGLTSARHNESRSKAAFEVTIPDTKSCMPHQFEYDHIIHPATLDSIFHAASTLNKQITPMIPTSVDAVYVPLKFASGPGTKIRGHCFGKRRSKMKAKTDMVVCDQQWSENCLVIKGLETVSIETEGLSDKQGICSRIMWQEDIRFLARDHISLVSIVELAAFKKPGLSVLMMEVPQVIMDAILLHIRKSLIPLGIRKLVFLNSSVRHRQHMQLSNCIIEMYPMKAKTKAAKELGPDEKYEVIITGNIPRIVEILDKHLAKGGLVLERLLAPQTAGSIPAGAYRYMKQEVSLALVSDEAHRFSALCKEDDDNNNNNTSMSTPPPRAAITTTTTTTTAVTILIPKEHVQSMESLVAGICKNLERREHVVHLLHLEPSSTYDSEAGKVVDANRLVGKYCISLMEACEPQLADWVEEDFELFKTLFSQMPNILWVTRGAWPRNGLCQSSVSGNPMAGMFWGLARTLVSERWANIHPVVVDLDPRLLPQDSPCEYADSITEIFIQAFEKSDHVNNFANGADREFLVNFNGSQRTIEIPRLVPMPTINHKILSSGDEDVPAKADVEVAENHDSRVVESVVVLHSDKEEDEEEDEEEEGDTHGELVQSGVISANGPLEMNIKKIILLWGDGSNSKSRYGYFGVDVFGTIVLDGPDGVVVHPAYAIIPDGGTLRKKVTCDSRLTYAIPSPECKARGFSPARFAGVLDAVYKYGLDDKSKRTVFIHHAGDYTGQVAIQIFKSLFHKRVYVSVTDRRQYDTMLWWHGISRECIFVDCADEDATAGFLENDLVLSRNIFSTGRWEDRHASVGEFMSSSSSDNMGRAQYDGPGECCWDSATLKDLESRPRMALAPERFEHEVDVVFDHSQTCSFTKWPCKSGRSSGTLLECLVAAKY